MAARRAGWEVSGVDADATLERALELGAIDHRARLDDVRGAEMVVLAAPVSRIPGLLAELAPTEALITDVAVPRRRSSAPPPRRQSAASSAAIRWRGVSWAGWPMRAQTSFRARAI